MNDKMMKIDKQNLKQGMVLANNIHDFKGNILVSENTKLKDYHIQKIQSISDTKYLYIKIPEIDKIKENAIEVQNDEFELQKNQVETIDEIRSSVFLKVKNNLLFYSKQSESNFKILFEVVEQIIESVLSSENMVYQINKIQSKDDDLYNHSINTAILSILIGISVGFKSKELTSLAKGAFFSDIGKLNIEKSILLKPDYLTKEEYKKIQNYPEYGYQIMKKFDEMNENSLDCILHSREKVDGTGYPHGLKGENISIFAKIISLSTYFDSLCSEKPYRGAISPYKAMSSALGEVNSHFDSDLIKKTIKILGYYDVGMFVELTSSNIAKVVKCGRYKPILNIIKGAQLDNSFAVYEVDMNKNPSVKIKDVLIDL